MHKIPFTFIETELLFKIQVELKLVQLVHLEYCVVICYETGITAKKLLRTHYLQTS